MINQTDIDAFDFYANHDLELGDCLWYIAAICRDLGLNMGDVAADNLAKLKKRKENNTLHGSGDNR